MRIAHNIAASQAVRYLGNATIGQQKASQKLGSGLRINYAVDDAAGLSISEKMRSVTRGLSQASLNSQDGISLVQSAEAALQGSQDVLKRMKELSVQAANDVCNEEDRAAIQTELDLLNQELTRIATSTKFNGRVILDGAYDPDMGGYPINLQVGASTNESDVISVALRNFLPDNLGVDPADVSDHEVSQQMMDKVDDALVRVSTQRGELGAVQNRLDHSVAGSDVVGENMQGAESQIRDTDMSKEMMNLVKGNLLNQSATSMLSQANQVPQRVLELLQ